MRINRPCWRHGAALKNCCKASSVTMFPEDSSSIFWCSNTRTPSKVGRIRIDFEYTMEILMP